MANNNDTIKFEDVAKFCREHWLKVLVRGGCSLLVLVAVVAIAYAITPSVPTYDREVLITMQEKAGRPVYPNGQSFSYSDLVTPAVLDRVYKENALDKVLEFDDFCDVVRIGGMDVKRAKIDAEYKVKLGKRNITATEMTALERDYRESIAALPSNVFTIQLEAPAGISKAQAVKIVNDIPETWFQISSLLEAEPFPLLPNAAFVLKMKENIGKVSALAQCEQMKLFISQLQATAKFLQNYGLNRNFVLESGETVRDIQNNLQMLQTYELNLLQYNLAGQCNVAPEADTAFVNGNLLSITKDLTAVGAKATAIGTAVSRLEGNSSFTKSKIGINEGGILQLDGAFFQEYAQLIRSDANNVLRSSLVQKGLDAEESRSDLEAQKQYYQALNEYVQSAKGKTSSIDIPKHMATLVDAIADDAAKLHTLRDMITKDNLSSRKFYVPIGRVRYAKNFEWPFMRIVLLLTAIWAIYNLICLMAAWSRRD